MKLLRYIALAVTLIASGSLLSKPALAGAVAPGAASSVMTTVQTVGKAHIIEVRKGRPKARKAKRRRPGAHRPNYKRKHSRRKYRGRRWGQAVGGVIIGTAIGVAIAGSMPPRPAPGLCWAWTDSARTRGYWYDC